MIDTIYIARHGYRMNWVTKVWTSETGTPRDPPLAAYGHTQAQELADYFLALPEEERPTAIFSSPYFRCLQTSKPIAAALNLPIYAEHGLSEWYSPAHPGSGLHPRPHPATHLMQWFPEIDPSWQSIWYPSRKGEDISECHDRTTGLLEALVPEVERRFGDQHRRILLVSHAATIIALNHSLMGDREAPMRIGCCSLTEMRRKTAEEGEMMSIAGGWDALRIADGSHMKEGVGRDWGFEDVVIRHGDVINDQGQQGSEEEDEGPVGLQLPLSPDISARM